MQTNFSHTFLWLTENISLYIVGEKVILIFKTPLFTDHSFTVLFHFHSNQHHLWMQAAF